MQASRRAGTLAAVPASAFRERHDRHQDQAPEVTVQLTGTDGTAFAVLGAVRNALAGAGVSEAEQAEFCTEATARDYDTLLQTCMR